MFGRLGLPQLIPIVLFVMIVWASFQRRNP
jgi:hypothetical protein